MMNHMTPATHTITDRHHFAVLLSEYRTRGVIRSYGRLAGFGRSIVLTNGTTFILPDWSGWLNYIPPMNIHPKGGM